MALRTPSKKGLKACVCVFKCLQYIKVHFLAVLCTLLRTQMTVTNFLHVPLFQCWSYILSNLSKFYK